MKRSKVIIGAAAMLIIIFSGCMTAVPSSEAVKLSLALTDNANWSAYGKAMADCLNKLLPEIKLTTISVKEEDNVSNLIAKKAVDLTIVSSDAVYRTVNGQQGSAVSTNIQGVAVLYSNMMQVVVKSSDAIYSIADIRGKRVGVAAENGLRLVQQVLTCEGIESEKASVKYIKSAEGMEALQKGAIDVLILIAEIPNEDIKYLSANMKIRVIPIALTTIQKVIKDNPYTLYAIIPAYTYKGQIEAVATLSLGTVLIANADVPEEMIYKITKTMFEEQYEMVKGHYKAKELMLENATRGLAIPLHPGAKRFYEEKRIM